MKFKAITFVGILGSGLFVVLGEEPVPAGAFTAAQAEAGRTAYERTCGHCHMNTLLGRVGRGRNGKGPKGDTGERPPVSSLAEHLQKFIGPRGFVPPLTGDGFIERFGGKTAGELVDRFQETAGDPSLKFEDMTDETTIDITAYVLRVNGAKAGTQPLTRTTGAIVSSIIR